MVYYNDNDPKACAWLRELMADGLIPEGKIDDRSILEVQASDLGGFTSCHWFAGIGGWAYALRLAGWPDDRPVWTASLPCQPFSAAGKQAGVTDERHLWPCFHRLARERKPGVLIGEQVAGAVGFGWLDRVFADLEADSYTCGAVVLGAHSVGAPHIRQRLYWVAHAEGCGVNGGRNGQTAEWVPQGNQSQQCGETSRLADSPCGGQRADWHPCSDGRSRRIPAQSVLQRVAARLPGGLDLGGAEGGFPLAGKIEGRVALLRGYGNSIIPQVAAEFIGAVMEATR